jgi:hypothetical protein
MDRYVTTLVGPLAVLLIAAIFVHAFSLSLGVMLLSVGALILAPAWAGWLLVVRAKISPWAASFSGPLLMLVDVFIFGYLPSLALGRFSSAMPDVPEKLVLGSPQLTLFVGVLVGYLLLFPISLAIAGLGAYIGFRDSRTSQREQQIM